MTEPSHKLPFHSFDGSHSSGEPDHSFPSPSRSPAPIDLHFPDATSPDFSQPDLQITDFSTPTLDPYIDAPFGSDPWLPDLDDYQPPLELSIYPSVADGAHHLFASDPFPGELLAYEQPDRLLIQSGPLASEPLLPNSDIPEVSLPVTMTERPADLSPEALSQLHDNPAYRQIDDVAYLQLYLDQHGNNTARQRHFNLLRYGLHNEEL